MIGKPSLALDLPPEIISDIFVHCLPCIHPVQRRAYPFEDTRPQVVFDLHNAPLLLTRVCRRWRVIAEATPTLWTRLPRSAKVLELYQMYIKNSGDVPLWAHLTFDNSDSGQHVAELLTPHSHRWEHLTLTFGTRPDNLATHTIPTQLPILKHLQLKPAHSGFPYPMRLNAYQLPKFVAPLLKSVAISSSKVLGLDLPWSQLTHYTGEFNPLPDIIALLSLCINLEVLHLHNPRKSADATPGSISSPLCLPHLHDLLLIDKRPDFSLFRTLIDCLNLPVLETVGISIDRDLEPLRQCVMRSSPDGVTRLRSVEVRCSQGLGQPPGLQELSLAAPQIQELRIIDPSAEVLLAMEFRRTNPLLFPRLQYLTLIDPFLRGFELVDIINSRCHPPPSSDLEPYTRLRHIEVMVTLGRTPMIQGTRRYGMVQPFHEEFQDVAECFTDDPNFNQMCERLKSILIVREPIHSSIERYQLPSHWGRSIDPLLCFFEFSDSVFTFFENYEVYHPLLLSRYPVVWLLQEFLHGHFYSDGLLRTHQQGFLNRARTLLDKWQPIIAEYNKKERWIVEIVDHTHSLVRKAEDSVYRVVYCTAD